MIDVSPEPADGISPLEALLELPRSAGEDPLVDFLETVAETVCRTAGYTSVVLNTFRPAWDDYEAVLVIGDDDSVEALIGSLTPRSAFRRIIAEAEQPLPGVFFLSEESGFWADIEDVFVPELVPRDDPNAWLAGDGLVVFLSDSGGAPLAFLSMDEPASGLRPTSDELRLVRAICSHAEQALRAARRGEAAQEHTRILGLLLESSPALTACTSATELLELAGRIVVPELGFERYAAYLTGPGADSDTGADSETGAQRLALSASAGWAETTLLPAALDTAAVEALLARAPEQAGCLLGGAGELFPQIAIPDGGRSTRNGHGAAAWRDHCLVLPCRDGGGALQCLIVIEDPADRQLPSLDRRRAVRLLIDQVCAALVTVGHRDRLHHLAGYDELTGVRNRRGLDEALSGHREVALLVCDLDRFKQVNDAHGHERGDQVLARFGELLRELARETDIPMRLGGEEFCVVLAGTDRAGAVAAAERLRAATARRLSEIVPEGVTVSIGVAATTDGVLDARGLLSAADRGLYAAKAAGRNRAVWGLSDPEPDTDPDDDDDDTDD